MFTIMKNTKNDEQNALRRSTVYSQCMRRQVYRLPLFLNTVWLCVVDASIKYSVSKNEIIVSRWWLFCVFLLNCSACFSFSRHYKISFTRPVLLRPAVTSTHARTNARTQMHIRTFRYTPIHNLNNLLVVERVSARKTHSIKSTFYHLFVECRWSAIVQFELSVVNCIWSCRLVLD